MPSDIDGIRTVDKAENLIRHTDLDGDLVSANSFDMYLSNQDVLVDLNLDTSKAKAPQDSDTKLTSLITTKKILVISTVIPPARNCQRSFCC